MLDFVKVEAHQMKDCTIIYPEFIVKKSKDLMIRGKAFYAIWDEEQGLWSKNEDDVQRIIDKEVVEFSKKKDYFSPSLKLLKNFSSKKWLEFQKYCKSLPDNFHELDSKIVFQNDKISKDDYVTKTLPYSMADIKIPAYDELMDVLYGDEERKKIEWSIGAIISGDSKKLQKFIVIYGEPGAGKSTILNIIQKLFPGYYSTFESKALSSSSDAFSLESFKDNPLIAIQHDGDLSRIEDNTKLNRIVSHESLVVNEKFKATYSSNFHTFLYMGTNKPVKITDAKSGILRRLIDVTPTGNKIPVKKYMELIKKIPFELSGIAARCLDVYNEMGFEYYDSYTPLSMIGETNDFYNFIEDNYDFFIHEPDDGIPAKMAWARYKEYCQDTNVLYPYSFRPFKAELKNYFKYFDDRWKGQYSVYREFLKEKFEYGLKENTSENNQQFETSNNYWLNFNSNVSIFDDIFSNCLAQYATDNGKPITSWDKCKTTLKDIDTKKMHYVKLPENIIVVDFDIKEGGEKNLEKNIEAANQWPETYAEISRSGQGIHLIYYYEENVDKLSRLYDTDIEIKTFKGGSAIRRMLTTCCNNSISLINSGLPKKVKKMISNKVIEDEKHLRTMIEKNLRKEIHPNTKPSVDFIYKLLDDAYNSGIHYDVRDMRPSVQAFCIKSTNQSQECMKILSKMKFCSEETSESIYVKDDGPLIFFDVEVFPNLFVLVWKKKGDGSSLVKMINPSPMEISDLMKMKLIGFNNRRYDNHIIYARSIGYTNEELYKLSQKIISGDRNSMFREAYNISYTDVFDFLSAKNKMSLKKWEIKLHIHHQELGLPWDQPVPENLWSKVADYCANDVVSTEKVFDANQTDWLARKILAKWAGMTENDTSNVLTTRLIVGKDSNPQSSFIYTDLSTIFPGYRFSQYGIPKEEYNPDTKIVSGKSIYMGEDPGEGGKVNAVPGMYNNVALLDIASMHLSTARKLKYFGKYQKNFEDILDVRLFIKHGDFESAKKILPESIWEYLDDASNSKGLAAAVKTPLVSIYGLTSAKFENKLKHPKNIDNILAKYGALFMIKLRHEVEKRGWKWIHIKTDSIKIADATTEAIEFIKEFGKQYGFTFEHEATYSKMCLVNESTYIAKVSEEDEKKLDDPYWSATGKQFQVPFVFKTLFGKEPIEFYDMCETRSVSSAMYLDFNENLAQDEHDYHFVGKEGLFVPVKDGKGGGYLLRKKDEKYDSVTDTKNPDTGKPYRWLEAEMFQNLKMKKEDIDLTYYRRLVDDAIEEISKYGDFENFVSEEPFAFMEPSYGPEEIPFN